MQDVYDFFYDVNVLFQKKALPRLDDELRSAIMSGVLSDMLTASLAKHSRSMSQNKPATREHATELDAVCG